MHGPAKQDEAWRQLQLELRAAQQEMEEAHRRAVAQVEGIEPPLEAPEPDVWDV